MLEDLYSMLSSRRRRPGGLCAKAIGKLQSAVDISDAVLSGMIWFPYWL